MPDRQAELPGFSEDDLTLLRMNETQRQLGLPDLTLEDILPPQPDYWPTAEELREAGQRQRPAEEVLA